MGKFIGTTPEEESLSWFDFWSIGHLLFGAGAYFIIYTIAFYVFYTVFPNLFEYVQSVDPLHQAGLWGLIGAIVAGILWEPIENIGGVKAGWKDHRDSWPNLIMDCICVFCGALILYVIHIVWINLVIVISLIVLIIITGYLTMHNTSSKPATP